MHTRYFGSTLMVLALVGIVSCSYAQPGQDSGGALLPEQASYDVTFYDLAMEVQPAAQRIEGTLTAHADVVQPLSWFVQDLDTTLRVQSVELVRDDGTTESLSFERRDAQLWTELARTRQPGEEIVVRVRYGGTPREAPNPPWDGGFTWSTTPGGAPWIATSVQIEGADLWWPTKDHPSDEADSMALHFTAPRPLVAASNGRLQRVEAQDTSRTYHWFVSTSINNYGVALNAAPYRTIEDTYESVTGEEIPVTFWVLPAHYEQGKELFPQFKEHLRFYEELLGPYPFRTDKYGVAETPHLGMEHQTIIAYGSDFTNNRFGFDGLHHHELGHEWWGNLVTAADWSDFWIHEGFCTYMQALYAGEREGREAYHQYMAQNRSNIRNQKPVAPSSTRSTKQMYRLPPDYTTSDSDMYYKGAWILHTLRFLIGEEAFFEALRRMAYPRPALREATEGQQTRFATTRDFVRIAEEASGRELDWFFEVYLRQAELPRLVTEQSETRLQLEWAVPDEHRFPMPVPVRVGEETRRVGMTDGSATIELPSEAAEATVDPKNWVLKERE